MRELYVGLRAAVAVLLQPTRNQDFTHPTFLSILWYHLLLDTHSNYPFVRGAVLVLILVVGKRLLFRVIGVLDDVADLTVKDRGDNISLSRNGRKRQPISPQTTSPRHCHYDILFPQS